MVESDTVWVESSSRGEMLTRLSESRGRCEIWYVGLGKLSGWRLRRRWYVMMVDLWVWVRRGEEGGGSTPWLRALSLRVPCLKVLYAKCIELLGGWENM